MVKYFICLFVLFCSFTVNAREIAGVSTPETVHTDLQLNGAGIRSKFFLKKYEVAPYLEHPSTDAQQLLDGSGRKRMTMYTQLHKEVDRDKPAHGWEQNLYPISSGIPC